MITLCLQHSSSSKVRLLFFLLFLTTEVNEIGKEIMTSLTNLPPIARLSNKVIRILGCNPGPMTLQGTNTYLVGTGNRRVLVDSGEAGTASAYIKLLDNVLREENATIEHLVITHWHHDHIGGVQSVQKLLTTISPLNKPPTVWKLRRSSNDDPQTDDEKSVQWEPLNDDQIVEVEGAKLQVKHTPGHTTDHACLLLQEDNILFSGDCVLGEGTVFFEDLFDYMLSLKKILTMKPRMIYPGHGPVLEDPISRIQYYIKHRTERELQILQMLKDNVSTTTIDIIKEIYKGQIQEDKLLAATIIVDQHLNKLRREGKVLQDELGDWWKIKGKI